MIFSQFHRGNSFKEFLSSFMKKNVDDFSRYFIMADSILVSMVHVVNYGG